MVRRRSLRLAAIAGVLLLSACVVVPKTVTSHDPECGGTKKQVTLDSVEVASINGCNHSACLTLVAIAGATAAVSAMVSGGIAVLGNVGYWLEKQGQCRGGSLTAPAPAAPSPAPAVSPPAAGPATAGA